MVLASSTDHYFPSSQEGIGHSVWSECPHHAENLQGALVLPLARKLLLLRTLTVHKLLPAFSRTLNQSKGSHHECTETTSQPNRLQRVISPAMHSQRQRWTQLLIQRSHCIYVHMYMHVSTHANVHTSMSLSRFLKTSRFDSALMPPQHVLERKSTGLITLGVAGKRRRKSNSPGSMALCIIRI